MLTKLLSHARHNAVAYLALFVAMGGTAIAAKPLITGADVQDGSLTGADVLNDSLAAADLAPNSVGASEITDGQVDVAELAPGALGARAWGLVNVDGNVLRSKNVTGVTKPGAAGVFCVDPGAGIDPTTAVMVLGPDGNGGQTSAANDIVSHVEWNAAGGECPGAMRVETYVGIGSPASGGATDSGGFDLEMQAQPFTFVIP